jgi:hypothetical protein
VMAKYKPVYEHQDGRGHSVRYAYERDKRRRERKKLEKLMSKTYFTNPNSSIESSDGKHHNDHRGYGVFDFETHGPRSHRV